MPPVVRPGQRVGRGQNGVLVCDRALAGKHRRNLDIGLRVGVGGGRPDDQQCDLLDLEGQRYRHP